MRSSFENEGFENYGGSMKQISLIQIIPTYQSGLKGVWTHLLDVLFHIKPVLLPMEYKLTFWCDYDGEHRKVALSPTGVVNESL